MTLNAWMVPKNKSIEYKKTRKELEILANKIKQDPTDAELYIKMNELYKKIHELKVA